MTTPKSSTSGNTSTTSCTALRSRCRGSGWIFGAGTAATPMIRFRSRRWWSGVRPRWIGSWPCSRGECWRSGRARGWCLSQVAPECVEYWGTDFSASTIQTLQAAVAGQSWGDRVRLRVQPADVAEGLPQGHFDVVVLNSVVQYFPSAGYLTDVHRQWRCDLLAPGGALFIGDVRNHTLQGAFQTAVALARTTTTDTAEIRQRVQRAMLGEARITAGPGVFHQLGRRPAVGGRARHPGQTRIGRQRTEPVPLRRHRPQNPHTGTLTGHRTHLGVDPMRGPARTAHPVDIPTSRRRPHHRDPPRRTDHRRPHRTGPGRRATPGRRTRPSQRHRDPRHRHPRTTAPPRRNHRIPRRGHLGRRNPAPSMPSSSPPPTPAPSTPHR